ncbi:ATP-binding cassette sub-family B member 10, mitochondrial-like [Gigantopelta aegis]|uniref:ATP-binding cassette sub-family B member 10, mitochondrial-like n=1 Tax=Gigantopelta aegis TaxID=1735272 RepID=UPI001B88A249|nr:ATP-binding cassette sub-family B member 10, mitochondrial-like [Gigantopelta aegis]
MLRLKPFRIVNNVHISGLFDVCKVKVTCRSVARCQCFGHLCKQESTFSWPFLGSFYKRTVFKKCTSTSLLQRNFPLSRCSKQKSDVVSGQRLNKLKLSPEASKTLTPKARPKASDIKRLLTLAKPESAKIAGAVALLLVSSSVTIAIPFCMGKVIDIIYTASQDGHLGDRLKDICKILLVVFIMGSLANFGRVYLMQIAGQNIVKRLREKLFGSIIKQEIAFFDKTKTGELINRLSTDTSLLGQSVTMNISDGLRAAISAIGGISMMVFVCPKLAAISMGIVPPIAVVSVIYGRYVKNITRQVQDKLADATQFAEEKLGNVRTVRAFAHEKKEISAYSEKVTDVLMLSYKEALARGIFWGSTGLSGNVIVLSVLYYGGIMMTEAQITVGDLSAFLLYAAYVGISFGGLSSFYTELMRGLGASSRIWQLVHREPRIPLSDGLTPSGPVQGNVEFEQVSFYYPSRSDVAIFNNFNLVVPAGSVTAVVGSSGSGKSTVAGLLLRYYDPANGKITFDSEDIRALSPLWLRSQIGVVSQEPVLFSCSIMDNIAYGSNDPSTVTTEQIIDAAKKANCYTFVTSFPSGFNTLVGERGLLLSGGQRQRIAIARAILKNPKILILDEATSALDAESEFLVQDALENLMVDRTVITIAHRLSTIRSADQIAVIDGGRIAEIGSYDDLMLIPHGIFRKLVERQTITR